MAAMAPPVLFWRQQDKNPYLSNWFRSEFVFDNTRYGTVEQCIMHRKAILFGDVAAAEKIMATGDPAKQKKIGRRVKNFTEDEWVKHRRAILLGAVRAKFASSEELSNRLEKTGDRIIAEASPSDKIYGIGWAPADKEAQDVSRWKGLNLLGEVLMQVRAERREARIEGTHAVAHADNDETDAVGTNAVAAPAGEE